MPWRRPSNVALEFGPLRSSRFDECFKVVPKAYVRFLKRRPKCLFAANTNNERFQLDHATERGALENVH